MVGDPLDNRPLAERRPERLSAIPVHPWLVAFLAVAHETATDQVLADRQATVDLRNDVIEGWAAAERLVAIGTAMVPFQVDLITSRAACDQAGFFNVVLIHTGLRGG